jgi:serine protease DegQ
MKISPSPAGLLTRRRISAVGSVCLCTFALFMHSASAQVLLPVDAVLPLPLDMHASGFFINAVGDVLTARHAVVNCESVYVVKGSRTVKASVIVMSPTFDLAVLGTSLKPYLSATFTQSPTVTGRSIGVFTEAYSVLRRLPNRGRLLSNAMTISAPQAGEDASAGGLQLLSGVHPGASGSAVVGRSGLLLGVVVERVAVSPGAADGMLSRAAVVAGAPTGATQVRAVSAAQVKDFLRSSGIAFSESDAPQIGETQSPAARAATLAVGVICG